MIMDYNSNRPWWDTLLGNPTTFLKLAGWIALSWVIVGAVFFFLGAVLSTSDCIGTGI